MLLLLLALAQPAEPQTRYSLESYLRIVGAYRSANRAAAVREIRKWRLKRKKDDHLGRKGYWRWTEERACPSSIVGSS